MAVFEIQEIKQKDWPNLKEIYSIDYPKHIVAYGIIQHYMEVKELNPKIYVKFLSINETWQEDGTFCTFDNFSIQICSLKETGNNVKNLVERIPLFMGALLYPMSSALGETVEDVLAARNINFTSKWTKLYWLPLEEAAKFKVDPYPGTYLASLKPSNASQINALWPHKYELPDENISYGPHYGQQDGSKIESSRTSVHTIIDYISYSESVGLFDETTGDLMSWVMLLFNNALGALQTEEKHLCKGYGRLVIKAMAKSLASKGKDTYGFVVLGNYKSENLFKSLNFTARGNYSWVSIPSYDKSKDDHLIKPIFEH